MRSRRTLGGGTFYDRSTRRIAPSSSSKQQPVGVVGPGGFVRIRSDASWSVPEPELTLLLTRSGDIIGYTAGNDMSSRDIEGENPLYLPQAKIYDGSCAARPIVLDCRATVAKSTAICPLDHAQRDSDLQRQDYFAELKREPRELANFSFAITVFLPAAYLMTGTGIVPGDALRLRTRYHRLDIDGIGRLRNHVTVAAHSRPYHGRVILTPFHTNTGRNGQKPPHRYGKVYSGSQARLRLPRDTADGAQRPGADCTPAQTLHSETTRGERDSAELAREPSFIRRVWGGDSRLQSSCLAVAISRSIKIGGLLSAPPRLIERSRGHCESR